MTTDLAIYRSAHLFVDQHGDEAPVHAAMKADAIIEKGDLDGQRVWLRIVRPRPPILFGAPSVDLGEPAQEESGAWIDPGATARLTSKQSFSRRVSSPSWPPDKP